MTKNFPTVAQPPKLNLNRVFTAAVHLPRRTDSIKGDIEHNKRLDVDGEAPLYPHGDTSRVAAKHSSGWFDMCARAYNSPSNARVVCLGRNGAHIGYWLGIAASNGLRENSSYQFGTYTSDNKKVQLNPTAFEFTNIGLRCLTNPVFSNLEELWISAEVLDCRSNPQAFALYRQLAGIQPGQILKDESIRRILEMEISTASKPRTIEDTFPVLRSIVIVSMPPNVMDFHAQTKRGCLVQEDKTIDKFLKERYSGQRVSVGENLAVLEKENPQLFPFGYVVCPILTGDITKFSLGDYRYDERYLSPFREQKIMSVYGANAAPTASVVQLSTTHTDVVEDTAKQIYGIVVERLSPAGYESVGGLVVPKKINDVLQAGPFTFKLKTADEKPLNVVFNLNGAYCVNDGDVSLNGFVPSDSFEAPSFAEHLAVEISEFVYPTDTTPSNNLDEALADIIKNMESEGLSFNAIRMALWAYKQSHTAYFTAQIPLLPDDIRERYQAVFQ